MRSHIAFTDMLRTIRSFGSLWKMNAASHYIGYRRGSVWQVALG